MKAIILISSILYTSLSMASFLKQNGFELDNKKHKWKLVERVGNVYGTVLTGTIDDMSFTLNKAKLDGIPLGMNLKEFANKNKEVVGTKEETYCRKFNKIESCYYEVKEKSIYRYQLYFTHKRIAYSFTFSSPNKKSEILKKNSVQLIEALIPL